MKLVVKFGGTSLKNGERIENAAESIKQALDHGHEATVVASAMGNTTDELLDNINFNAKERDRDEIISMGERTSVRMLKAALESKGVDAEFIEPCKDSWPVKVDSEGNVKEEETRENTGKIDEKMENGVTPVVTGFLAEDPQGNVTTLARGGSDTT
ncbi:MAG: aspartate kinase, partial [Candidatus Nanohaloarchaea archaeon]